MVISKFRTITSTYKPTMHKLFSTSKKSMKIAPPSSKPGKILSIFKSIPNICPEECSYRFLRRLPYARTVNLLKNKYSLHFKYSTKMIKLNSRITDLPPERPIAGRSPTGDLIEHESIRKLGDDKNFFTFLSILLNVHSVENITFNKVDKKARLFDALIWVKKSAYSRLDIYNMEIKETGHIDIDRCRVAVNPGVFEVFDKFLKLVTICVETKGSQENKDLELTGNILISVPYLDDFEETGRITTEKIERELIILKGYKYSCANLKYNFFSKFS